MKHSKTKQMQSGERILFCPNGNTVLPVRIERETAFFCPEDGLCVLMAAPLAHYLASCMQRLPLRGKVSLVFYCPLLSPTRKDAVRNMVRLHFAQQVRTAHGAALRGLACACAGIALAGELLVLAIGLLETARAILCAALLGCAAALWALCVLWVPVRDLWKSRKMLAASVEFFTVSAEGEKRQSSLP